MSDYQARRIVIAVALVVTAVVFWENLVNTGNLIPPAKTVVTMLVLITGLSIGASLAPEVFGPLTLLVGTAIAISRVPTNPGPFLSRYAGQKTTAPPPSSTTAGTGNPYGGMI